MSDKKDFWGKLLTGYVRNIEKVLRMKNVSEIRLNYLFVCRLSDVWNRKYSNKDVMINDHENGTIITVNSTAYVTAFGSLIISNDVFNGKLKYYQ